MISRTILFCLLILAGCDALDPAIREAEKNVREKLRDPDSAKFSDVSRCGKSDIVSGNVNSKNGYGGYTGKQPFVAQGYDTAVMGDSDDADTFIRLMGACSKAIEMLTAEMTAHTEKSALPENAN